MPAGTIPFIAIDSLTSIVAGRANRALPKTLARFNWPTWSPTPTPTDRASVA
jgi:hypothetical protein